MKTKINSAKRTPKSRRGKANASPRKSIEERDLNQDCQDQRTNTERDEDLEVDENQKEASTDNSVEAEEEREKKRKVEDVRRDEVME